MVVINTKLGGTDPSDGQILTAENFTDTINATIIKPEIIYTGSGYDSSGIDNTDSEEIGTISAATLVGKNYLKIEIFGTAYIDAETNGAGTVKIKIQTKDIGGSYVDSLTYKNILNYDYNGGSNLDHTETQSQYIVYYHTLTTDEKTNGVGVTMFSNSTSNLGGSSFTNIQTVVTPYP